MVATTRSTNLESHPGIADLPKTRRTPAEVQEEREAQAKAKALKQAKNKAMIDKLALKEKSLIEKQKSQLAGQPQTSNQLRIKLKRPTTTMAEASQSGKRDGDGKAEAETELPPRKRARVCVPEGEKEEPSTEASMAAPPEGRSADGEPVKGRFGEGEEDGEAAMTQEPGPNDSESDASESEEEGVKPPKMKKGVEKRELVRQRRDDLTHLTGTADAGQSQTSAKRKSPAVDESSSQCPPAKKGKQVASALRQEPAPQPLLPVPPPTRPKAGSKSSTVEATPEEANSAFQTGGISSDEEGSAPTQNNRYKSLVQVKTLRRSKAPQKTKRIRNRPTKKDLPKDTQESWGDVQTLAFNAMARHNPWIPIPDNDVIVIWNTLHGEEHPLEVGPNGEMCLEQQKLFEVVKFVIKRDIGSRWIHGISQASEKALEAEWGYLKLKTVEERADYVKTMLGDDEPKSKRRPFIWEGYDTYPKTEMVADKKGVLQAKNKGNIFRGRLLARTLAKHIELVTEPLQAGELEIDEKPRGALMMSILALTRTLMFSKTGIYEPPSGKMGEFSEDNWGDRHSNKIEKGTRRVRIGTAFEEYIGGMQDKQWAGVMEKAYCYVGERGQGKKCSDDDEIPWETSDEGDSDDLRDPEYDASD